MALPRFRLSTILLVMVLVAILSAWATDRRKIARLEAEMEQQTQRWTQEMRERDKKVHDQAIDLMNRHNREIRAVIAAAKDSP